MTTHIIKLCVGAETIEDVADWQKRQAKERARHGLPARPACQTRMTPKRVDEVLDGGSLYWVCKGMILVRNRILDVTTLTDRGGRDYCEFDLDAELVLVEPTPRKAFQGWRYFQPKDAPADLSRVLGEGSKLPSGLARDLREAGVW